MRASQLVLSASIFAIVILAHSATGQTEQEVDSGFFEKVEAKQNGTVIDTSQENSDIVDVNDGAVEGMLEANGAREMVTKTTVVPFRYIGFLRSADGTRCTGALISPRHVLTAGHCVFDYRGTQKLRDRNPIFWPALSNNMSSIEAAQAPYGSFRVINIQLPVAFVAANSNQAYDVAVLTLESNATDVGGFFPIVGCTDGAEATLADPPSPVVADSAQGRRLLHREGSPLSPLKRGSMIAPPPPADATRLWADSSRPNLSEQRGPRGGWLHVSPRDNGARSISAPLQAGMSHTYRRLQQDSPSSEMLPDAPSSQPHEVASLDRGVEVPSGRKGEGGRDDSGVIGAVHAQPPLDSAAGGGGMQSQAPANGTNSGNGTTYEEAQSTLPESMVPPPAAALADENSTRRAFRLNVAGYPADQDREMWAAFCGDVVLFPRDVVLIQHECNTFSGMSGSPLWRYTGGENRAICAIHKADALVKNVENLAVPLYRELVAFIQSAVATSWQLLAEPTQSPAPSTESSGPPTPV